MASTRLTVPEAIRVSPGMTALNRRIESGEVPFPFRRYFFPSVSQLIHQLIETLPEISTKPYTVQSFYPPDNLYLDSISGSRDRTLQFRGTPVLIIASIEYSIDQITDLYIEDIRLATRRPGFVSVLEYWTNPEHRKEFLQKHLENFPENSDNPKWMRETLYHLTFESKQFRPSWCFGLFETVLETPWSSSILKGKSVLDISAGWGDRLLATMLSGGQYFGTDPNLELHPRYRRMIDEITPRTPPGASGKVLTVPFEQIPARQIPDADLILTSPPYFDLEVYPGENQSIQKFPERTDWFQQFLFPSLAKAWSKLRVGGFLLLHLGDSISPDDPKTASGKRIPGQGRYNLATPTLLFIETFIDASWEGGIGVTGEPGRGRPVWVWKKVSAGESVNRWSGSNSSKKRSIAQYYPDLTS